MFHTSLARAWKTHFCLPVARSMAMMASEVPVAGGEVFSPVEARTRPRLRSTAGVDQIGAPEGPSISTPALFFTPRGLASGVACQVQITLPVVASTALTAPWVAQQAKVGRMAWATSRAEIGTISFSPAKTGAPVRTPPVLWRGSARQISLPVATSQAWRWPPSSPPTTARGPALPRRPRARLVRMPEGVLAAHLMQPVPVSMASRVEAWLAA